MMRRIRRLVRHADPGTVRRAGAGLAAVVLMVGLGFALQAGRDGGPSSADAASATSAPATVGTQPATTTSVVPTTAPAPAGPPRILAFDAPERVDCGTVTSIEVSWETADATLVRFDIDGSGSFRIGGPEGSARLPFACDGAGHVYRLVAVGVGGEEVSVARRVDQTAPPG